MASSATGLFSVALSPVGAGPLHEPPTVTVDAPTGTVTSGPEVTVAWTYVQDQGDLQEAYRIVVQESPGGATVYDSGYLAGGASQVDLDWDALELETEATFDVSVYVASGGNIATDTTTFTASLGDPQITILIPADGAVHSEKDYMDVTWTFNDPGHTQSEYRIRLLSPISGAVLASTGWVVSGDQGPIRVPYVFSDNTEVTLEVQAKNDQGIRSE